MGKAVDCQEHLARIRELRGWIESGSPERLEAAAKELRAMEEIRPWLLEYLCARAALMLARGEDTELCRMVLNRMDHELYPHEELMDIFRLKQRTFPVGSNPWNQCAFSMALYGNQKNVLETYRMRLDNDRRRFLLHPSEEEALLSLRDSYFITRNMLMYFVLTVMWCFQRGVADRTEEYLEESAGQAHVMASSCEANWKYLERMFCDGKSYTFVLVDDRDTVSEDLDVLAAALKLMGHHVVLLRGMVSMEALPEDASLKACIKAAETKAETIVIPFALREDGKDNRAELVDFLARNASGDGKIILFSTDRVMDALHSDRNYAKRLQRMSPCLPEIFGNRMAFAWAGDYRAYVGYIYGFSVAERMERPAECEFSIVIPVRNSAETLRDTLRTCLDLVYPDFEIVLSDNSDAGNDSVYLLWQELNDSRIRYYRTPCELPLASSFEFAFLQAKGEFIFAIGADDGVFPWALDALHRMLPKMGKNDVLLWSRGSYAWPDFQQVQEHQLILPLWDKGASPQVHPMDVESMAGEWLRNPRSSLFGAPLLYINSGFRRSYFRHLYEATGRLWDGSAQDVYMGVVNCFVCKSVSRTSYPITIAGMSRNSIGLQSSRLMDSFEELRARTCKKGVLDYAHRRVEFHCLPFTGSFRHALFWAVWRLHDLGCVGREVILGIDRGAMFTHFVNVIVPENILFECQCRELRYMASLEEGYMEPVEKACQQLLELSCQQEQGNQGGKSRLYLKGVFGNFLHLDASEFGIRNIHDAVGFCARILNLASDSAPFGLDSPSFHNKI